MRETRCVSLLPRTTLHSDSEQYFSSCFSSVCCTCSTVLSLPIHLPITLVETPPIPHYTVDVWGQNTCGQEYSTVVCDAQYINDKIQPNLCSSAVPSSLVCTDVIHCSNLVFPVDYNVVDMGPCTAVTAASMLKISDRIPWQHRLVWSACW